MMSALRGLLFRPAASALATRRRAIGAMAAAAAGAMVPVRAATLGAADGRRSFGQIAFDLAGVATVPDILLEACSAAIRRPRSSIPTW